MLKTNKEKLPILSVLGEISSPGMRIPYRVGFDGVPRVVAGTGGITCSSARIVRSPVTRQNESSRLS